MNQQTKKRLGTVKHFRIKGAECVRVIQLRALPQHDDPMGFEIFEKPCMINTSTVFIDLWLKHVEASFWGKYRGPIPSMYGIFTYIWRKSMVNVAK